MTLFRVEIDAGRLADLGFVFYREVGFDAVAEHHCRQIVGKAARQDVVVLHGLDIAIARHGNAVFGAFNASFLVAACARITRAGSINRIKIPSQTA